MLTAIHGGDKGPSHMMQFSCQFHIEKTETIFKNMCVNVKHGYKCHL